MAVALAPSLAKVVDSHSANAVPPVITNITAGLWDTCALSLSGEVYCWGNSSYGKLGSYVPDGSFPAPILGFSSHSNTTSDRDWEGR